VERAPDHAPGDERLPTRFVALCLNCLGEIPEDAHFCRHCLRPLTSYAMTGPIERVWAVAWGYGRLIRTRRLPLPVVLGTWTLLLLFLAAELALSLEMVGRSHGHGLGLEGVWLRFVVGTEAILCGYTLYRITRNRLSHGDDDPG